MKSYFAASVQAAMREARAEMGVDAILVTTRTSAPEARHLGEFEVVFAADVPESATAPPARESEAQPSRTAPSATLDDISAKMRELKTQFASWRRTRTYDAGPPSWMVGNEPLEEAFTTLLNAEVEREFAVQLMAKAHMRVRISGPAAEDSKRRFSTADSPLWDERRIRAALKEEIRSICRTDATLGATGAGPRIVALVGPPGVGKTTTIAKLATEYALSARKPSAMISIDSLRVGASESLRVYSSILGIGLSVVETNRALAQAIEEHRNKELIFIDTPGLGFRDLDHGRDLADFLARRTDVQTHLCLAASLRSADLARIATAYEMFRPSRLLFTRLDETDVVGPVLHEAARSGHPISFFSDGQRVPEDLHPAGLDELTEALFSAAEGRPSHQLSAA